MSMCRYWPSFLMGILLLLFACGDEETGRVIDLDGPRGRASPPGPWTVEVVGRGPSQILVAIDDGAFEAIPLSAINETHSRGRIPDQPVGTRLRYFAVVGDDREPRDQWYEAEVRSAPPTTDAALPGGPCQIAFRRPLDGGELGLGDDNGPQAGLQITVVAEGALPDGTSGRLLVEHVGYASRSAAGVLAFQDVNLPNGDLTLIVEATTPSGAVCGATVEISVSGQP